MRIVTVIGSGGLPVRLEVTAEVYEVVQEQRREIEREKKERQRHRDRREFENCLLFEVGTEPLEETLERRELFREIYAVLFDLPAQQRQRFILHFIYGYSYGEIAKMQGCRKYTVQKSVRAALQKIQNNFAA